MGTTTDRIQDWMKAITFAEAGEWETAQEMIPAPQLDSRISTTERIFMAAAFAEAGEWGTAGQMLPEPQADATLNAMEKTFMAAAFAEAGLPEEALRIIGQEKRKQQRTGSFLNNVGLEGVRATYAVLAVEKC